MAATTSSATQSELDWTKPGPGSWQLDGSHFEPDCARLIQGIIKYGMTTGMADGFNLIGGPLKGLEAEFVNGNFYYRMVPLVAGNLDLPLPPAPILWLMTRVHPAFRRQAKKAKRALAGRVWNDELQDWQQIHRPHMMSNSTRLAAQDPSAMSHEQLADHLAELIDLLRHGARLHFRLHVSDLGPIGLLLVQAREWGLDKVEVMATLAGSSPATSAPALALAAVAEQVRGHGPFPDLDSVRAVSPAVADLLDDFMSTYGWRLTTGYDLSEMTLHELPEIVLAAINAPARTTATPRDGAAQAEGDAAAQKLRQQLDPSDRADFDRMVSDARALYGLRDENGPITYQWPAGLLRRGLLNAADRLVASGKITDAEHVFDLEADELDALLRGGSAPSAALLAGRCVERKNWKQNDAPLWLGPEPVDPPLWTLPGSLAKLMDVILTVLALTESDGKGPALEGVGIGAEAFVGTARVVTDESEALSRIEPGDVLIAPFTVPTYNAVLAIAGAVVVENGGLLCHAAVIAREYGIAGLVGVPGATTQIPDGAMVRVDPVAGTVRLLAADGL